MSRHLSVEPFVCFGPLRDAGSEEPRFLPSPRFSDVEFEKTVEKELLWDDTGTQRVAPGQFHTPSLYTDE